MNFQEKVTAIRGVGPKTANLLNKLGIQTVGQLLCHKPAYYKDLSSITPVYLLQEEEFAVVKATIMQTPKWIRKDRKFSLFSFSIGDGSGYININIFNLPFLFEKYHVGDSYIFMGKPKSFRGKLQLDNPEILSADAPLGMLAYYPLTAGLSQNALRQMISNVLEEIEFSHECTSAFLEEYQLYTLQKSFIELHQPQNAETLATAKNSLAFREILLFLYRMNIQSVEMQSAEAFPFNRGDLQEYLQHLPFSCTTAQIRAMQEISADLAHPIATNRLIQGDVGSGKTAVALFAVYIAQKYGYQSLILAPTALLAEQHFHSAAKIFEKKAALLTGATTEKQRRNLQQQLKNGEISILISTHAALYEQLDFPKLKLLIIDEQHRFGVIQRSRMVERYPGLHKITMSATPIPRSLAMILHGSADISILDELPPGRIPVQTFLVDKNKRRNLYDWLAQKISEGEKAYIICPLWELSEGISAVSVQEIYQAIQKRYPQIRVAFLHGQMKNEEKTLVMSQFRNGEIQVIVATTVVEVGVDVSDATIIIIENADRFGLAQLHQLRGRVGRGDKPSYCYLVSDGSGIERLKVLKECNNGFEIARKDLAYRGAGNFFGTEQHGTTSFSFADLIQDAELFQKAKEIFSLLPEKYPEVDHIFLEYVRKEAEEFSNTYSAI